jgi:uncharacterized protein (TIGR02147 family)
MTQPMPDIVGYAEYRVYLKDRYAAMRAGDRKFSHRYITGKAGMKSAGWFSDIVMGRQRLKPAQVGRIADAFRMDRRERDFLSALVELERADNPEERVAAMEKWLALKGFKLEAVDKDRFAFFDHWYHLALRELLSYRPFTGDYAALGSALQPPIGAAQARKALDLLQRLGLILPQTWNRRVSDLPVLVKSPGGETKHWNKILKALMKLAPDALETFGKHERDFSALTLSLSPEGLKKAGEEIAQLRKRLLMIAEKDKARNRVFQCLFQIFPLTQAQEISGE